MKKRIGLLISIIMLFSLVACSGSSVATQTSTSYAQTAASVAAVEAETGIEAGPATVADAIADNDLESAATQTWNSADEIPVIFNGSSITASGSNLVVDGSTVTVTAPGTYSFSGTLDDGQIIVDCAEDGIVRLVLNGVTINSSSSSPIYILNADEAVIFLAEGKQNTISDAMTYVFASTEDDEPNAAIFSKTDLVIDGSGSLTVNGNYNDGIASKDGLTILNGMIAVSAVDDGIRGKDFVLVENGSITVNAGGDGLKSDNEEDATKGYILLKNGVFNITSSGDAISAQTDAAIAGGEFTLTTAGGSTARIDESISAKGIKGLLTVNIDGGAFTINAADDAIHSNASITVNAGSFNIASGDDGFHSDGTLTINEGTVNITESYEGLEAAVITINGGDIHVTASDDGINAAGGLDSSGSANRPDMFAKGNYHLYINGGRIVVNALSDGLDINGSITMTNGVALVSGSTDDRNAALDYDSGFSISGGLVVAAGSSGMAQAPDNSSSQNSVLINFTTTYAAGTLVHIQNSAGEDILTYAPAKEFTSVTLSTSELVNGETYSVFVGGSSTGTATDNLYEGGSYTAGDAYADFTVAGVVTNLGQVGMGPGMQPGVGQPGGGRRRP